MNSDIAYEEGSIVQVPPNSLENLINEKVERIEEIEEVKPETVHIRTNEKVILRHVKPQDIKYWHFKFSDPRHTNQLTNVLQNIRESRLTVEYSFKLNTADIILKQQGEIVGKVHLLLCDKRDANLPSKYYCKLFFFHFKNNQLFQAVKTTLVNFFENFKASQKRVLRPRKASLKRSLANKRSLTNKDKRATRQVRKYSLRPQKASLKSLANKNKNVTRRAHKYSLRPRKVKPN
jgi:hypothetical protein